jgi:DUF971 family protein
LQQIGKLVGATQHVYPARAKQSNTWKITTFFDPMGDRRKALMNRTPIQIEKFSPTEMRVLWSSGENYAVPFAEMRFYCPCAACVDEHTGHRILTREAVASDIRPSKVEPVGRYAIAIHWSDGHSSGIYHFDTLFEICSRAGKPL